MSAVRTATVPAFAKVNLSLLVLGRRSDGYHEIRTVFQTISLADRIRLEFEPGRRWHVEGVPEIPGNLAVRAAELLHEQERIRGRLRIAIDKRIPMGGGLGGGSSDAAAILLALPVLAGRSVPMDRLHLLAAGLGSDVPLFLEGGTLLGLGRGEELYPLPTPGGRHALVLAPGVSVLTPEAYRRLNRPPGAELTLTELSSRMKKFRALVGALCAPGEKPDWQAFAENDFEAAAFGQHPRLGALRRKLSRQGAEPARMSGSGSALFGVFHTREQLERARRVFQEERAEPVRFLSRREYRAAWARALRAHRVGDGGEGWPLRSRHEGRT